MTSPVIAPLCDYDARIVSLLGRIDTNDVNRVVDLLLRLDADSSAPITVFISCQGGDIVEGLKLLDTVQFLRSPLTAVGLGLVEGAGVLLLAAGSNRVLYPSVVISTAGVWDSPRLHDDGQRPIGLSTSSDLQGELRRQIVTRIGELNISPGRKLPALLAHPTSPPQILDAESAIRLGLADAIINGANRFLSKPKHSHVKPTPKLSRL